MNEPQRPVYFYLFPKGNDIEIRAMTDMDAARLLEQGKRFLDIGQKTREEAEALRRHYLSK